MESLKCSRHMNVTAAGDQVPKASTANQTSGTRGMGKGKREARTLRARPRPTQRPPRPKAAQELEGLVEHGPAPDQVGRPAPERAELIDTVVAWADAYDQTASREPVEGSRLPGEHSGPAGERCGMPRRTLAVA